MGDGDKKNKPWWQPAIFMFFRISVWIVGPVLVGLFVGKWLDEKYNTDPWFLLLSICMTFVFSVIGLVKSAKEEFLGMEKEKSDK